MKNSSSNSGSPLSTSPQKSAVGKYLPVVLFSTGLLELIGIYGFVLFLLSKDTTSLYQLLTISALAMIYYRSRKKEFLELSAGMITQNETEQ